MQTAPFENHLTLRLMASLRQSLNQAERSDEPYRHWLLKDLFPADVLRELQTLDFPVPQLGGVSGSREVHNATRVYFDADNQARFPMVKAVADCLQSMAAVEAFEKAFGGPLKDTLLRIEYAQDTQDFWLQPHTDIGVKKFTMLIYLSDNPAHSDLGTDIYRDKDSHYGRAPYRPNGALVFIPSNNTWHGFEPRSFPGVRKSLIVNYVTQEWRDREQLSFPNAPVY